MMAKVISAVPLTENDCPTAAGPELKRAPPLASNEIDPKPTFGPAVLQKLQ
jgi:hypothetical protein